MAEEKKKKRMAGEALSGKEKREEYRASLLTNDDLRQERIEGINFHEGLEALPENYDDKKVVEALRGSWGKDDLARYKELMGGGSDPGVTDNGPTPGVTSAPTQTITTRGGGRGPSMNVQQDNDIINSFTGNDNVVRNTQDNSVTQNNYDNSNNSRYYGGSERNFSYGGDNISNIYEADPQSPVRANDFLGDFMRKYGMKSIA